jgi:hypothetical protein
MREMNTDRPDTTESAYTVDAGHYQIEMSFFDYARDRADGERTETWRFGAVNLKAGLCNQADLQIVFDSYTEERTRAPRITDIATGFSEYAGVASHGETFDYQATFNGGVTYAVNDNLVFDAGIRIGLNEAADELGVFTGMSIRF